jgi:archaemetzincin
MKIKIVPLGEVDKKILKIITEELKVTYRMVGEVTQTERLPQSMFNAFRNQYRSDEVLDFLEKHYQGRILGVTKEDLYTEGLNYIFGQAKMRGRVALISICRLDPKFFHQQEDEELFEKRVVKESIHEVGHMLGLTHCNKRACVMSFSNTAGEVDQKTKYLCDMCKIQIDL